MILFPSFVDLLPLGMESQKTENRYLMECGNFPVQMKVANGLTLNYLYPLSIIRLLVI